MSSLFDNPGGKPPRSYLLEALAHQIKPKADSTIAGGGKPLGFVTDEMRKIAVWSKGQVIDGYEPTVWRRDFLGRAMKYPDYGNRNSTYGWEIDHIVPKSVGGSDDLTNLRPLHCTNNAALGGILGSALRGR